MELEQVRRESKRIDFKEEVDFSSHPSCCEIIKDIVALANSGGGVILIGVKDNGDPSEFDVTPVLSFDPAKLTDKVAAFTHEHYSDFDIKRIVRDGHIVAAIQVQGVPFPMVFEEAGVYRIGNGTKSAFAKGTVYFRHGAKSEPGTASDLRHVVERELLRRRKTLLGNVRKVVTAPLGSTVHVIHRDKRGGRIPNSLPIRLVNDPSAPAFRQVDTDFTYPYRQTELLALMNQRIGDKRRINAHDLLCVRRAYNVDAQPQYFHKPKFGSPQYSNAFADWLVKRFREDANLFEKARLSYKSAS